jgi:cytochrome c-type biogenesis protein CcmF
MAGLGVTIFAVAAMNAWKIEDIRVVQVGESFPLGAYEVLLKEVHEVAGPNYTSTMADDGGDEGRAEVAVLYPEKRVYPVAADAHDRGGHRFWPDARSVSGDLGIRRTMAAGRCAAISSPLPTGSGAGRC